MSELPPLELFREKLLFCVLPAAVGAAVVYGLGLLLAWVIGGRQLGPHWQRAVPSLTVLALMAGVVTGPLLGTWNLERISVARAAGDSERAKYLAQSFPFELPFPWVPDGKWWHWGWYAIGLAMAVEFAVRLPGVSAGLGHLFRGVAAGVIASVVLHPDMLKPETRWWLLLTAGLLAINWAIVDAVGRRNPGSSISAAMAIVGVGAATVLIHDAAAGFTDVSTSVFTGLTVVSLVAWTTRTDANAAGAAAVVPVAVLLLLHRGPASESAVPVVCYWLVGLAPLGLAVFLLPPVTRFGTSIWATPVKLALVAVPTGVAVYRVVTEAPLVFSSESW